MLTDLKVFPSLIFHIYPNPMKKSIFFAFALFVSLSAFAQQPDQARFDYQQSKHEFSLDLLPIIDGSHPFDLLYRKHYISKKGNDVALRLALQLGSSFSANETSESESLGTNISLHNYHISVGKEKQIPVSKNIQSYFGVDFGAGYSNSAVKPLQDDLNSGFVKSSQNAFNFSSTGFLGFKYHISPNFSIGAETALSVYYNHTSTTRTFETNTDIDTSKSTNDNLGLRMNHIRSIRFAYHF